MRRPRLVLGLSVLGVLGAGYLLTRPTIAPTAPGSPGSLPGGPLPPGTTALTADLSDAFFRRLHQLGDHFRERGAKITDEELMGVLYVESGGLHADAVNRLSGCVGLNQICPTIRDAKKDPERVSGLRAVGWPGSREDYLRLSPEEQLTYVQRFFDNGGHYRQITDHGLLYLVNFSPAFFAPPGPGNPWFGRYPIMYQDPARGGTAPLDGNYTHNAGIDSSPKKGYIELADMARFVRRHTVGARWNELRGRLARASAVA